MKAKDIVKHKVTDEAGFVLCLREDLPNRCDVQWAFDSDERKNLSFEEKVLCNQGCYHFDELEIIYSTTNS